MRKEFRENGFVLLDAQLQGEEIAAARAALQDLVESPIKGIGIIREEGSNVVRSLMGWQRADGVLSSLALDERIIGPVKTMLGTDAVSIHQTKWNPKAPNSVGEKWDPHRGDLFWHFKDGVPDPNGIVSVLIALTDQTEENGAVFAWKGSHVVSPEILRPDITGLESLAATEGDTAAYLSIQINPTRLAEFDEEFEKVSLVGPAGSIWVVHSGLLHASAPNCSTRTRELIANVYRRTDNLPTTPRKPEYLCEPD